MRKRIIFHAMHDEFIDSVSIGRSVVQKSTKVQRVTEFIEDYSQNECQTLRCKSSLQSPEITHFWELGADVVEILPCDFSVFGRFAMMVIVITLFQT